MARLRRVTNVECENFRKTFFKIVQPLHISFEPFFSVLIHLRVIATSLYFMLASPN